MSEWISVEDRLPDKESYCLIFVKKNNSWDLWDEKIVSGYIDADGDFSDIIDNVTFHLKEDFTYWLPSPEPPQDT